MRNRKGRLAAITWLMCDPEPYLAHCQRCGRKEAMPKLPMLLDAAGPLLEAIVLTHELCEWQPTEGM